MYFDKEAFIKYFVQFFKLLFGEFIENIGWIFGFYERNQSFSGPEFIKVESNVFKIIFLSPIKTILMVCYYTILFCSMIIGVPFALLYNVKFK